MKFSKKRITKVLIRRLGCACDVRKPKKTGFLATYDIAQCMTNKLNERFENSVSCDSLRLTLKEPFKTEADGSYYDKHFIVLVKIRFGQQTIYINYQSK